MDCAMYSFWSHIRTLWIITIVFISNQCNTEVTEVSYSTSYPTDRGEDYIVDGEPLTLECVYTGAITSITWWTERDGSEQIFSGSPDSPTIPDTVYKYRIDEEASVFTSNSHHLVITVNKEEDDEQEFKCTVVTVENPFGSEKRKPLLDKILVPPTSVSQGGLGVVIEGVQQTIECEVSSVYKGQDVTEFSIKVGNSKLTSGTKSQTTGSVFGTYNVKYTQTVTFTYSQHHGQKVQCEVTWMDGTSVDTVRISAGITLNIYVRATVADLQLSQSSTVEETSVIFMCSTSSNPSPRLRLYRQREGQTTSIIQTDTGITKSWSYTVQKEDNNAEFYCRVDDNKNILGWEFDVQSHREQLTVYYKPSLTFIINTSPNPTEGDIRPIECTSTSANPEPVLSVYRGGVVVKSVTGRTLSYSVGITREINGVQFKCTATSSDTAKYDYSVTSDGKYYTVLFKALDLSLAGVPSTLMAENTEVTVTCTTDEGNPTPTVRWHRDGQSLPVDTDLETVTVTETDGTQYNGKVRISTLKIQADRTLNEVEYICSVEDTDLVKSFTLGVKYPPEVSVQSLSGSIEEGSELVMNCEIQTGNPQDIITHFWEFEPKYPLIQSQALPEQRENRKLRIERTVYSDAGTFRCTAGNTVGSDTGVRQIVIHYPPQLFTNDDLTFYCGLGQEIILNITVRAFPELYDINSAFTWTNIAGGQITAGIMSNRQGPEVFYSELKITETSRNDYGKYTVTVDNGVKSPVSFLLDLQERGVPQPPHSLVFESVTAISVTLSWIPGESGGANQTFTVYYRQHGETTILYYEGISENQLSERVVFKVSNLLSETEYLFRVQAQNKYGESVHQSEISTTTLGMPVVNGTLQAKVYEDIVVLYWPEIVGDFTKVTLWKCNYGHENCISVDNVTVWCNSYHIISAVYYGEIYFLVVYQDVEEVVKQEFIVFQKSSSEMQMFMRENTGLIAGLVVISVILVVITLAFVTIIIWNRKHNMRPTDKQDKNVPRIYENVTSETSQYEMAIPQEATATAEYTDLKQMTYEAIS